MNRYVVEDSFAVLDTKTGLRKWFNTMREAIDHAQKMREAIDHAQKKNDLIKKETP
jgi:hypothetical protein